MPIPQAARTRPRSHGPPARSCGHPEVARKSGSGSGFSSASRALSFSWTVSSASDQSVVVYWQSIETCHALDKLGARWRPTCLAHLTTGRRSTRCRIPRRRSPTPRARTPWGTSMKRVEPLQALQVGMGLLDDFLRGNRGCSWTSTPSSSSRANSSLISESGSPSPCAHPATRSEKAIRTRPLTQRCCERRPGGKCSRRSRSRVPAGRYVQELGPQGVVTIVIPGTGTSGEVPHVSRRVARAMGSARTLSRSPTAARPARRRRNPGRAPVHPRDFHEEGPEQSR